MPAAVVHRRAWEPWYWRTTSGKDNLKLTGDIIADIYLGKITKWNDSRIAAINPGVDLPDKAMSPVYRSDGSGTTFVFSDYDCAQARNGPRRSEPENH